MTKRLTLSDTETEAPKLLNSIIANLNNNRIE